MTGRTSIKRTKLPSDASVVALRKQEIGMRRAVVPVVGSNAEIVAKHGGKGTGYAGKPQIQVRRMGRSGPTETSSRARALKNCKGKRGCEFVDCVRDALGKVPTNLAKTCPR